MAGTGVIFIRTVGDAHVAIVAVRHAKAEP